MWLPDKLIDAVTDAGIKVFYVSFQATRLWASERDKDEPLIFSGYYWAQGAREAGPFRSMSAAYRDAWFRVVRHRPPPMIAARNVLYERKQNIEQNKASTKAKQARAKSANRATRGTNTEARIMH